MTDITKLLPRRGTPAPPPPPATEPQNKYHLHPAAAEAAATFSDAMIAAERLQNRVRDLEIQTKADQAHIALLEKQLDHTAGKLRSYQAYAVELTSHVDGMCASGELAKAAAHRAAAAGAADGVPDDRLGTALTNVGNMVDEAVAETNRKPRDLDQQ